ncbi:hypothetical protein BU26DRAFT_524338 [Trematosphaeria pertusa]|uniref:F-box domain-containing protein n=1 Tax=Trematosphaeria pertusa TaxID=390896 RepID=A0A6A6HYC1_9PLEO|nr:uncharacterized protein BU26DRAFT_524338 [Trematosphaeria pertusa]KAF2242778.1 hypothetical protein BU26DRAFT_524338 [Trematosphaeria pertusa]
MVQEGSGGSSHELVVTAATEQQSQTAFDTVTTRAAVAAQDHFSKVPTEIKDRIFACLDADDDLHSLCLTSRACRESAAPLLNSFCDTTAYANRSGRVDYKPYLTKLASYPRLGKYVRHAALGPSIRRRFSCTEVFLSLSYFSNIKSLFLKRVNGPAFVDTLTFKERFTCLSTLICKANPSRVWYLSNIGALLTVPTLRNLILEGCHEPQRAWATRRSPLSGTPLGLRLVQLRSTDISVRSLGELIEACGQLEVFVLHNFNAAYLEHLEGRLPKSIGRRKDSLRFLRLTTSDACPVESWESLKEFSRLQFLEMSYQFLYGILERLDTWYIAHILPPSLEGLSISQIEESDIEDSDLDELLARLGEARDQYCPRLVDIYLSVRKPYMIDRIDRWNEVRKLHEPKFNIHTFCIGSRRPFHEWVAARYGGFRELDEAYWRYFDEGY